MDACTLCSIFLVFASEKKGVVVMLMLIAMAFAQDSAQIPTVETPLPSLPINSALPWLVLAFFIMQFSLRFPIFRKRPNWMQPLILIFTLLGFVALLSKDAQQWFLLALVLGLGFSLHRLVLDGFAFVLILIEQKVMLGAWVEGKDYAGRVQNRSWRCVTLKDGRAQTMIVPNRFFLSQALRITPPGSFSTKLRCWIPQGLTLIEFEERVLAWIPNAPWVSDFYGLYPDSQNPQLILIELSLLRAEDKNVVLRALRTIVEERG